MPSLSKVLHFEITPEQYVRECDDTELLELSMEIEKRIATRTHELHDIEVDHEVVVKEKYLKS